VPPVARAHTVGTVIWPDGSVLRKRFGTNRRNAVMNRSGVAALLFSALRST